MAVPTATIHGVCFQCGRDFERPYRGSGVRPTLCSNACKVAGFRARRPDRAAEHRAAERAVNAAKPKSYLCGCGLQREFGKRLCRTCASSAQIASAENARIAARIRAAAKKAIVDRPCKECGDCFAPEYGDMRRVFCSDICSKRNARRIGRKKERARLRCVNVEAVDPGRVFDRDGWRCQCCRKPTPREKRGTYHARAPELDHIIPLAKGGEHSYRNTQLLCRACNGAKSDTDGGQQMRLFG
jgi:5-methylcytosine-specific restriction endonuclease McrA